MTNPRHTSLLAVLFALLLVVDGLAWRAAGQARAPLPSLEAFGPEVVTSVELVQGDQRVRLERDEGQWWVAYPSRHPADPEGAAAIVATLARGVHPDARVGEDRADYGLEGADPIRVEAFADGASLSALYVGHDAPGGASFVRFSGSEAAYRARIGGRARFERSPGHWRDRALWRAAPEQIVAIAVDRADGERISLVRAGGRWTMEDDPGFAVDPTLADAIHAALARPVAVEIHEPDHLAPGAERHDLTVRLADGTEHHAAIVLDGPAGFAVVDGRESVYRLAGRLGSRLVAPREAWRDRTLWSLDPGGLRELELAGPTGSISLRRDPRTRTWVSSTGVPTSTRSVDATASFLARPRAERFVDVLPGSVGLPGERSIIVVGDRTETLQIGASAPGALDGRDAVYVRAASRPDRVGLVEAELIDRLWGPT